MSKWFPISTAPADGKCLLAIATDEGFVHGVLERLPEKPGRGRGKGGDWIYEGEPTYCLPYYFCPKFWQPLPDLPSDDFLYGEDDD